MLPSTKTIGIIGGGQLAKLMALEGIRLGFHFKFWADSNSSAISELGPRYDSTNSSLLSFCQSVDTVVVDYEHIPLHEIEVIEQFSPYSGSAKLLRVGRDRLSEKLLQEELGLPANDYVQFESVDDINAVKDKLGFPFILKKRLNSYDGKGLILIKNSDELAQVSQQQDLEQYIAEKFISFDKEYSLISVRDKMGNFSSYDVCENTHQDGILVQSKNIVNPIVQKQANFINQMIAEQCDYIGIFAVEYFSVNEKLVINEISPRVHNSGHWTLDASVCSQFENHLRACVGLPLGATTSHIQTTMFNIIGDFALYQDLLNEPHAKIYHYNKTPRPNRKIGHINFSEVKV
tara:strand:- start:15072 stop:16112 length:1041 start_codon:yes stop_codon:yes gene_type:complete